MTLLRAHAGLWALPLVLCGLFACGPKGDDLLGDAPEEVPEEEVEPRAYCPEVDAGALTVLSEGIGAIVAGPCGHIVFADAEQRMLYSPGAGASGLEAIDAAVWTTRFAPTGNLAAWSREQADGLILADLRSGERRELPPARSFGFVPVPGSEHGSDLWTCDDDTLALAGPTSREPVILAEAVDCDTVVGSGGSPRVAFADLQGRVHIADLEAQLDWTSDDDEYVDGEYDDDGRNRDDRLWIDYDGAVVIHDLVHWVAYPDSDAESEEGLVTRVIVGAETAVRFAGPRPWKQASVRHAAVVVREAGELWTFTAAAQHQHPGQFSPAQIDRQGRSLMLADDDGSLWRLSTDGATLEMLSAAQANSMSASTSGEWVSFSSLADGCLSEAGECKWTLSQLELWHEGGGSEGGGASGLPIGHFSLLASSDAGATLVQGKALEPGPAPDELPPDELLLYGPDMLPSASWPLNGYGFVRTRVALDDGRILVELHDESVGYLLLADPAGSIDVVPGSEDVGHNEVWVGATQQTLAFADRDGDGVRRLVAGAMP